MARLFGTDGVRGVANEQLSPQLAMQLGAAAAYVLRHGDHMPHVLLGGDTRRSGPMLEAGLIAGLCAAGAQVTTVGVIPTPGIAYLTANGDFDAGVVVSASHNPFEDNGIKFIGTDGSKLADDTEDAIEESLSDWQDLASARGAEIGSSVRRAELVNDYLDHLRTTVSGSLEGLRIVVDGANGAASLYAPRLFASLGADVVALNCAPNGVNINAGCGSLYPEQMQRTVRERGAHLGVAFDGDADRCIMADERGHLVDGDRMMAIAAIAMKGAGVLHGDTLVATIMSNLGLDDALRAHGIRVERTTVGDRYVAERMRALDATLGGEKSGHIIFRQFATTGDGMLTALQLMRFVRDSGQTMSELAGVMREYPQRLRSIRVRDKNAWALSPDAAQAEQWGLEQLGEPARVNIRASGTEPVVRVMAEASDLSRVDAVLDRLAEIVVQVCGAE